MRHQRRSLTRMLVSGLVTVACVFFLFSAPSAHQAGARQKERLPSVRSEMLVSTAWLARHLNDPRVVVLHVARERAHYDQGHIPGARFVAWRDLTATRDGVPNELPPVADLQRLFERLGIGDTARVIIYGDSAGLSAARVYFTLDYIGHGDRAALLDGGLEKWRAERRAVSTDQVAAREAQFTPRVQSRVVTDFNVMRDFSWTAANVAAGRVALIDARPVAEYSGETPGEGVARGGHIPGATNVFWMQNVVSGENPVMRPAAGLRRLYEDAGAGRGDTVVTYCRTGGQASHAYFTAKYLGYDVVMYDGSFIEWSNREGTPVVAGKERR